MSGLENMISVPMNFLMETEEDRKVGKQKKFLLEILANGGMTQKKIAEEAEARGIKSKTLWNAKRELEIDSVKRGSNGIGGCQNKNGRWQDYHFLRRGDLATLKGE